MALGWSKLQSLVRPKLLLGIGGAFACVLLGMSISPLQARDPVNSQLKEQVLQIIRENPEVILEAVQVYQQKRQQEAQQAQQAALQPFQANPRSAIGPSPTKGAKDANVVLVEFSDFQCPFCARAKSGLSEFMAKHQDRVTLVFKHLPLTSIHPQAMPAAKAAWAAGQQGKFWQFHDRLFDRQQELGDALYLEIAQQLNLDLPKFNRDRASTAATQAIQADIDLAEKLGVDGTPFFMMNGQAYTGAVKASELEKLFVQVSQAAQPQ